MTNAARTVLADCRVALEMLDMESREHRWRVHWAGAVALIRAVGHVLDKVDGEAASSRSAASAAFLKWKGADPRHAIFREFIEFERNNILKRYESNVHPLSDVPVGVFLTVVDPASGELKQMVFNDELYENLFKPMVDGFGQGEDARDVYRDAIKWWEHELDAIDATVAAASACK